jgi:Zn-dependent peptidase ImmA (M78 family)
MIELDIQFENIKTKYYETNTSIILKVNEDHPAVVEYDKQYKSKILGLCQYLENDKRIIYIVANRLYNKNLFLTTTMHELGHLIWLNHTDKNSIMHKCNYSNVEYFTYIDAVEIANVWNGKPEMFKYFKY